MDNSGFSMFFIVHYKISDFAAEVYQIMEISGFLEMSSFWMPFGVARATLRHPSRSPGTAAGVTSGFAWEWRSTSAWRARVLP